MPKSKPAGTYIWTGNGHDNDWNNAMNWRGGRVPKPHDEIELDIIMDGYYEPCHHQEKFKQDLLRWKRR